MKREIAIINALIVLIISLIFISCSPFFPEEIDSSTYDNFYEIKVINNYDAFVDVQVGFSDEVEISPFSSHVFLIESSYEKDHVSVVAEGKYFDYYYESMDIKKNFKNIHNLEAEIGWYGLKNMTEDRLDSPHYDYTSMIFEDDFESYSYNNDLEPGEIRFAKINEYADLNEDINFYLNGGTKRYKLNEINEYPELGKTKVIEVFSSNIVSYGHL